MISLSYKQQQQKCFKKRKLIYRWRDIERITCRKVLNNNIGIDVQTVEKKVKSFNLFEPAERDRFIAMVQKVQALPGASHSLKVVTTAHAKQKKTELLSSWHNNEITNQEFLLKLNAMAGRCFNDMFSYPIFPWTITDFSSDIVTFDQKRLDQT